MYEYVYEYVAEKSREGNMIGYSEIAAALGLQGNVVAWAAAWDQRRLSESEPPDGWPDGQDIDRACRFLNLPAEAQAAIGESLAWLRHCRAGRAYAWGLHRLVFEGGEGLSLLRSPWLLPATGLHPASRMFGAVVLLAGLDRTLAATHARGIPDSIALATLEDLELWMREYLDRTGAWGFDEVHWLTAHFQGRLCRLGRLQYEVATWRFPFRAYQHASTHEVVVLAEAGQRFRQDGQFDGANGITDGASAWTSQLLEGRTGITGNPVTPEGRAVATPLTLDPSEWRIFAQTGAPVLFIHIPAGWKHGPLSPEECEASLRDAAHFFPVHFPEHSFKTFVSCAWLLDAQFGDVLPADSNIVRFQKRFYRLPEANASDHSTMQRVFGKVLERWDQAPAATSLQRAVAAHVLGGGRWRSAAGFIPVAPGKFWSRRGASHGH